MCKGIIKLWFLQITFLLFRCKYRTWKLPRKFSFYRFAEHKTRGFAVRCRLKNRELETFRCKTIDFAPLFVRFYKLFVRLYLVTLETLFGKTYAFTYKSLTISLVGSKRKLHTFAQNAAKASESFVYACTLKTREKWKTKSVVGFSRVMSVQIVQISSWQKKTVPDFVAPQIRN